MAVTLQEWQREALVEKGVYTSIVASGDKRFLCRATKDAIEVEEFVQEGDEWEWIKIDTPDWLAKFVNFERQVAIAQFDLTQPFVLFKPAGLLTIMTRTLLSPSTSSARKLVQNHGVSINGRKITDWRYQIDPDAILQEPFQACVIRAGKYEHRLMIAQPHWKPSIDFIVCLWHSYYGLTEVPRETLQSWYRHELAL